MLKKISALLWKTCHLFQHPLGGGKKQEMLLVKPDTKKVPARHLSRLVVSFTGVSALSVLILVTTATLLFATPLLKEVCKDLVDKNEGQSAVVGADGWLFLKDELLHVSSGRFWGDDAAQVSRSKKKEYADPVPAIVSYNEALAAQGITLYLMPVPPKALIYQDKLVDGVIPEGVEDERALYTAFYAELNKSGVKVIDVLPQLIAKAGNENVYCKTDTHFSGVGMTLFASEAAKILRTEPWYEFAPKDEFIKTDQNISIVGDLSQMLGKSTTEDLAMSLVTNKSTGNFVESNEKSPVILLGDSHTLVFSAGGDLHAKGAGLFDHLSADLGFPVDLLGVRGSGITPARVKLFQRSKKNPDYLKGKKAVIWCFTAREFTGTGGWRDIPVVGKK